MLVIQGKQVFPAIAAGPLAFFRKNTGFTALRHIKDTEAEVQRFQTARKISIEQLLEELVKRKLRFLKFIR